jgi:hypothetical protein
MSSSNKKGFYYQASGNAFGGRIDQPFPQLLSALAPISLPSAGGYASARHEGFRAHELISIEAAYTQVAGSTDARGTFTTLSTSVIEGLNVNNIFFADRIAAQISLAFTVGAEYPRVSFLGTELLGLRIGGVELRPEFNFGVFHGPDPDKYPTRPLVDDPSFLKRASSQLAAVEKLFGWGAEANPGSGAERSSKADTQEAGSADNGTEAANPGQGSLLCSVVEKIEIANGTLPGSQVGHAISIPNFGSIFLAELIAGRGSFDLTMLRLELGCPVSGTVSAGQAAAAASAGSIATSRKKGSGGGMGSGG